MEIGKIAAVTAKAQEEPDIAKFEAGKLSGVVIKLQRRLDRLADLRCATSGRPPPLESGSDDSVKLGPDPGRSHRRTEAPRSDHAPPTRGTVPMPPRRSREEELDNWLSADYRRRCDPLQTPVQPKRPKNAPEPAPPAYGRYGSLRDELPEEDTEWELEHPNGDPMKHFGISPAQGSASRRRDEEEEYMEGVHRGVLRREIGGAPARPLRL